MVMRPCVNNLLRGGDLSISPESSEIAETFSRFWLLESTSFGASFSVPLPAPPTRASMSRSGIGWSAESGVMLRALVVIFFLLAFLDLSGRDFCFSMP